MCSVLTELAHCTQVQKTMKEIWKAVLGYEGYYEVSNMGNVKSLGRFIETRLLNVREYKVKILKPNLGSAGYLSFTLCKNGVCKRYDVHRLTAEAFVSNFNETSKVVDHINRNKTDNNALNLRMVTRSQNAKNTGKKPKGVYQIGSKWEARVTLNQKVFYLGLYLTKKEARNAYLKKATELFGEFADNNYLIDRQ